MHNSTVTTVSPRDSISLVSKNGSVLAGGTAVPTGSRRDIESNMTVTAKGIVDLSSACVEIAENITITASGSGFNCANDVIINLNSSEIRNDFGKTGVITVTACGGDWQDRHRRRDPGGHRQERRRQRPNKVSNLNGSRRRRQSTARARRPRGARHGRSTRPPTRSAPVRPTAPLTTWSVCRGATRTVVSSYTTVC